MGLALVPKRPEPFLSDETSDSLLAILQARPKANRCRSRTSFRKKGEGVAEELVEGSFLHRAVGRHLITKAEKKDYQHRIAFWTAADLRARAQKRKH